MARSKSTTTVICDNCGRAYRTRDTWRRFCTPTCRHAFFKNNAVLVAKGTALWRNDFGNMVWTGGGITPCYYCGVPADSIDHVTPRNILQRMDVLYEELKAPAALTVPSCRECNCAILQGHFYETMAERKEAAKDGIKKRYRSLLDAPRWTDAEIAELGDGLGQYVSATMEWKDWLASRLAW